MSSAAIDRLTRAARTLGEALDGGNAASIEAATGACAGAVDQVRAFAGWRTTPQLREALEQAARATEGARIRTCYLGDQGQRRLQALAALGAGPRIAYGRDGRHHANGA